MTKTLKVLHDTVLIKAQEDASNKGIMLPDSAKQKPTEGIVIEVGPGALNAEGKKITMTVEKGHRVIYREWAGTKIKFNDEDFFVMKESDIIAIIID